MDYIRIVRKATPVYYVKTIFNTRQKYLKFVESQSSETVLDDLRQ